MCLTQAISCFWRREGRADEAHLGSVLLKINVILCFPDKLQIKVGNCLVRFSKVHTQEGREREKKILIKVLFADTS